MMLPMNRYVFNVLDCMVILAVAAWVVSLVAILINGNEKMLILYLFFSAVAYWSLKHA